MNDRHIREMVTYGDSRDCFQGVDIAGGVSYFLRERDTEGLCRAKFIEAGVSMESDRKLNEYPIYIPSDKAVGIVRSIIDLNGKRGFYGDIVRARNPFGIGAGKESDTGELLLRYRGGITRVSKSAVLSGHELIGKWKVIVSKAAAEHAGQSDRNGQRKMLTVIESLPPNSVCSETYLVVDAFDSEQEANNLVGYLRTKFARYLIMQATPTQNISKGCFIFVPNVSLKTSISDEKLYSMFELSEDDIKEIETKMKDMPSVGEKDA